MSIIINKNNRLEKNLLIREGYMATYKNIGTNYNINTSFSGGAIVFGNWSKGYWLYDGIQRSNQKFEKEMIESRKPIMDEKWFAVILLHITNWEQNGSREYINESATYLRIKLEPLLKFFKEQKWSINELDNTYIQSVNEEYVYIYEELIKQFFSEIKSQEIFLKKYAERRFKENNTSTQYLWIENEITQNILDALKKTKPHAENIAILLNEEHLIFEFESKGYIEDYVVSIEGKQYFILTEKLSNDFEKFIAINENKNNGLTQKELDSFVDNMPLMIELKKESKILSKQDKTGLMKKQTELLEKWSLPKNFNKFREYLFNSFIEQMIKTKLYYSMKEKEENKFKLGKNHIGVNVFIDHEDKLKHIASDDKNFEKEFKLFFNVLPFKKYDSKFETYDKEKDYIFFEINSVLTLSDEEKHIINQILQQGRSYRNFIWFNLPQEEVNDLLNSVFGWNIMSLYVDKTIKKEVLKMIHPELQKVVKKVFLSTDVNEFLI